MELQHKQMKITALTLEFGLNTTPVQLVLPCDILLGLTTSADGTPRHEIESDIPVVISSEILQQEGVTKTHDTCGLDSKRTYAKLLCPDHIVEVVLAVKGWVANPKDYRFDQRIRIINIQSRDLANPDHLIYQIGYDTMSIIDVKLEYVEPTKE